MLFVLLLGVLWQGARLALLVVSHAATTRGTRSRRAFSPACWGSSWLVTLATLFAVPVGVGAGIFLEEYGKKGWLRTLIEINLSNLAGVPSIVYGILGMAVFVKMFGAFQGRPKMLEIWLGLSRTSHIPLPFGRTVLSGGLTLGLLILPIVIVASREALRAVPSVAASGLVRLGGDALANGPAPGPAGRDARESITGVILAVSRAIGETAPLLMVGPRSSGSDSRRDRVAGRRPETRRADWLEAPFDPFTALPIQIFNWVSRPEAAYTVTWRRPRFSCLARSAPGLQYRRQRGPRRHAAQNSLVEGDQSAYAQRTFGNRSRPGRRPRSLPRRIPRSCRKTKLEVQNLSLLLRRRQALFDVTVSIPERAVTALIGPSGCGKSTFLRTLNRMNDIIEGTRLTGQVLLEGTDIYRPDHRRRRPPETGRHGLPEIDPVSQVDLRERRLRAADRPGGAHPKPLRTRRSFVCAGPRCGTK